MFKAKKECSNDHVPMWTEIISVEKTTDGFVVRYTEECAVTLEDVNKLQQFAHSEGCGVNEWLRQEMRAGREWLLGDVVSVMHCGLTIGALRHNLGVCLDEYQSNVITSENDLDLLIISPDVFLSGMDSRTAARFKELSLAFEENVRAIRGAHSLAVLHLIMALVEWDPSVPCLVLDLLDNRGAVALTDCVADAIVRNADTSDNWWFENTAKLLAKMHSEAGKNPQ